MAGLRALGGSPLPLYGGPLNAGYSRCHAVAEALRRCGFRRGATSAAVANVARQWRRQLRSPGFRKLADAMAQFATVTEDMRRTADALSAYSALARAGAHFALARYARADLSWIIRYLGLYGK
jgi:hypothetical protein